jgi:arylsulfatase
MESDRSETQNLVDRHPDLVRQLEKEYEEWARRVGVSPWREVRAALPPDEALEEE